MTYKRSNGGEGLNDGLVLVLGELGISCLITLKLNIKL